MTNHGVNGLTMSNFANLSNITREAIFQNGELLESIQKPNAITLLVT